MNYFYNLKLFFENISNLFKTNIAIDYEKNSYTYKELNEKADYFVNYLKNEKIYQGEVVAIASTKAFDDYALMIACLKCGIIYVNLDVDNPGKRIENIFKICQPRIVFAKEKIKNIKIPCKIFNIKYVTYNNMSVVDTFEFHYNEVDGDSIAYIMFTSGSTGTPKGVAITHQNIIHLIDWSINRYDIKASDNFANISPMYFDNSVFDFYSSLFSGATLVPIKKELLSKPIKLVRYIDKMQCTIWFSVPSMLMYLMTMKVLNKSNLNNIRIFTFGGEGYPKSELKKLYDLYSDRARFVNVYGPTECTCICSSYDISENDFKDFKELPSLGKINQNFSYIILDDQDIEMNIGELCLLGPNVGIGYYNEKRKTEEYFSLFCNNHHYMKKMYKTGDLVEEKDGLLFFKGRKDNQIKHMGYRIELEEIECALNELVEIEQSAVLYIRAKSAYGKIIAFVASSYVNISEKTIKNELSRQLPSYMIPGNIRILDKLPKNPNGKINKQILEQNI